MKMIKIKTGQVWVSKKDGRLLYIGKKNCSDYWNTTNSVSARTVHKMNNITINKGYKLLDGDSLKKPLENIESPFIVKRIVTVTIKFKPKWMPKKIHKLLIKLLLNIDDFKLENE